ncbi:MAG: HD domain-containing protein [Candidatus Thorarchaeota archaeon]|nr:HD domain-containing protein [Candidatus Thorarchaeota archaeon]
MRSRISDLDTDLVTLIRVTGLREQSLSKAQSSPAEWSAVQRRLAEHKEMLDLAEVHSRQKAIQDPVHGAIVLSPWELDLVSSWEMLRLRYVRQLGPAHLVYPGANHTRFEHCLGTNFLAKKCISVVSFCDDVSRPCFRPLSELMDEEHQKVFRAAALLHDVGHPPTSHTIEFALKSWAGIDHTDLGEFLILHSGLRDVLEQNSIEPETVVQVLKRRSRDPLLSLISDFIDSPLDIDKTDYLIRDAHFSGVELGIFPAERVLLTNRVARHSSGRWMRAFMSKALHSLEALILSRIWMFSDLYLHHAVRVAEALTSKATYFRLKEEGLSKNECVGMFTRMTDGDLYRWLESSDIDFVREYAARIRYRRLFKVVLSHSFGAFDQDTLTRLLRLEDDLSALLRAEEEIAGDVGRVLIDIVKVDLGDRFLGETPLLVGNESSGFQMVRLRDTREGRPILLALRQQRQTIPGVRLYSPPSIAESVRQRFYEMFPISVSPESTPEFDPTDY